MYFLPPTQVKRSSKKLEVTDVIRILVVGNSSAGKTSILHFICSGEVLQYPTATQGCEVKVKEIGPKKPFTHRFVEFWEVGGNPAFEGSRDIFYKHVQFDGVMLVHDLSRSSMASLTQWIGDLSDSIGRTTREEEPVEDYKTVHSSAEEKGTENEDLERLYPSMEDGFLAHRQAAQAPPPPPPPLLVVGAKADLCPDPGRPAALAAAAAPHPALATSATQGMIQQNRDFMKFLDEIFDRKASLSLSSISEKMAAGYQEDDMSSSSSRLAFWERKEDLRYFSTSIVGPPTDLRRRITEDFSQQNASI
mmetsp:Transcript_35165/g.57917  ORF Transcript_35165/g.57917 Transcript_35165/m.57917 type:complete len:306 (+) Transcript_35165:32-949(+)